jgi:hypothetical protein
MRPVPVLPRRPNARALTAGAVAVAAIVAASFGASACTNTAVFDRPDPLQCGVGNGCGIAVCQCKDQSFMLDSACESGKCVDPAQICADRCADFDGVAQVVSASGDTFAIPSCEVLDDRMYINGCKEGVDLFATTCETSGSTCGPESQTFWKCIEGEAILSCVKGALHATGCKVPAPLSLCTTGKTP